MIPSIAVEVHPIFVELVFKESVGEEGGAEVALIVTIFELDVWPGALNVSVAVYVPEGKVTGKGVIRLSFEIDGVPEPVNCQLTVVDELIPLPVETKENKTVEPAQISKVLLEELNWGFVTKFACNCPKTELLPAKQASNTKTILTQKSLTKLTLLQNLEKR